MRWWLVVLFCVQPARASADALVHSGRALMGAPPLALVRSGLDPVSGGALFVSTLVDHKHAHLIANFAHHMHAVLPMGGGLNGYDGRGRADGGAKEDEAGGTQLERQRGARK